jgi:hypothetical protein
MEISASVDITNTGNYMTVKKVSSILYKRFGWIGNQTFKRVKGFQENTLKRREKDSHF